VKGGRAKFSATEQLALADERHGALTTAQRELAHTIIQEAGRLRLVLDRALQTDRLGRHAGPIDRTRVDLGQLVHQALRPLHEQGAAREVTIVERLASDVAVIGDSAKLTWMAASLVGNALRFSPSGARVDVRVSLAAGHASLRVRDYGPGVPARKRHSIFARDGGGALFLIREVVHAHGGTIRIAPAPTGAKFVVLLPRAEASTRGEAP
jgi:signal transduction histidine kinase